MSSKNEFRCEQNSKENLVKKTSNAMYQTRPLASNGWWLGCLIAIAYLVSYWKHDRSSSFEYKHSTIIAIGLAMQTFSFWYSLKFPHRIYHWLLFSIAPAITSFTIFHYLNQNVIFGLFSGIWTTIIYKVLFTFVLTKMPKSFTYGEASIVVQGFVIYLSNVFFTLTSIFRKVSNCSDETCIDSNSSNSSSAFVHHSMVQQLSIILQIGLLGVTFIVLCCYFIKFFRGFAFYILLIAVGVVIVLFPIDDKLAIAILVNFLTKDIQKLCMILMYIGLIGLTVVTVAWQMNRNKQSNTRTRKIFHLLIVFVFMPSLIYQCSFIFVASGIALALFIIFETIRIIQLPPLYQILNEAIQSFIDEKDAGLVALTPIYLLIGCSMPLWLHPCPCDLTDSAGFEVIPLLAGVISVGFGDTAASIVGSKFGKIKWPYSEKTVEGTIAGIIAQGIVLPFLIYFGIVQYNQMLLIKFMITVVACSMIETFTDQVDNLVLPLVSYILLSI